MTVLLNDCQASYTYCTALTRQTAGNFYFSFITLPADRQRDMCVLYAFMRVCDDLGDDESVPLEGRAENLRRWREDVGCALSGEDAGHPVLPALVEIVNRYDIPHEYLFAVIDGVEQDLHPVEFATYEELSDYCWHVAGAVGLCCLHVWGFRGEEAIPLAIECGKAFQLTNILRDLGEDIRMGRVYLPAEDLERFGYSRDDLREHRRDERFTALMQFEVERAKACYAQAERLFEWLEPPGRPVYASMLRIYGGLLRKIERSGYDVFSQRIRLSRWHKLAIAVSATVRHRWLRR